MALANQPTRQITTWWNTPNLMEQHFPTCSGRYLIYISFIDFGWRKASQMISSNLDSFWRHVFGVRKDATKTSTTLSSHLHKHLSFNHCKCVLSTKAVPYLTQTWNMWLKGLVVHQFQQKPLSTMILHMPTTSPCNIYIYIPLCPDPTGAGITGHVQGSQRFLEAHPLWLGDLSFGRCHVESPRPHVASFLGHPAQVSYVHRISRLSFKKNIKNVHGTTQTSMVQYNSNLSVFFFGGGELHETKPCSHVFPQGDIRAFLAPDSERHCDSSCGGWTGAPQGVGVGAVSREPTLKLIRECGNICCKSRRINHYGHKAKIG